MKFIKQNKKGLALKNSKGFTLLETLIYIVIFSIIIFMLLSFSDIIQKGSDSPTDIMNSRIEITNLVFSNISESGEPGSITVRFTLSGNNGNQGARNYSANFYGSAAIR
jgi:competence protein ComGC